MRGELLQLEDIVVLDEWQEVIHPPSNVGLPHAQLHLLVEQRHHRQRIGHSAVDTDDRQCPAPTDQLDRQPQRG